LCNLKPISDDKYNSGRLPEQATLHLNRAPTIPRAFVAHSKLKYAVYHIIEDFGHEEQQAIGYFYYLNDATIKDIAEKTELTENRVLGSICLYAERLESRLKFFKKLLPYDPDDVVQITDVLFHDVCSERNSAT